MFLMTEPITSFNGRYRFLSNFAPCKVIYDGLEYSSTEAAYQAAKTFDASQRRQIREASSPGEAKKLGRKVTMRPDWDNIKLQIMEDLLRKKFSQSDFKRALLNTADAELCEGNYWGDIFWGVCRGKGENHLGKLLMKIREDLRKS